MRARMEVTKMMTDVAVWDALEAVFYDEFSLRRGLRPNFNFFPHKGVGSLNVILCQYVIMLLCIDLFCISNIYIHWWRPNLQMSRVCKNKVLAQEQARELAAPVAHSSELAEFF